MDLDLAIIFPGIIIMLIVVGVSVNGIVEKVLDYKRSVRADTSGTPGPHNSELSERTAMIEDRLAVLERIATDRGQLLSEEIEQLRVDANVKEQRP